MKTARQAKREARQLYRLCLANGLLDEGRVRQVVHRVVSEQRSGGLSVLSRFQRLVRLDRAKHTADVESAVPLPADIKVRVQAGLMQAHGPGVAITFAENPALLAGVRIRVGSDVYDGSVQAGLSELEARL
jgi:F-type H+-transporting ATPase subunit delta